MDETFKKIIYKYAGELDEYKWYEIWEGISAHYIRRPLDKYGDPIYIGDSVWVGELQWPKEVKELRFLGDKNLAVFKDGFECQACDVFHSKQPVLDAGGRELEQGNIIWRLNDGVQGTVMSLDREEELVRCMFPQGTEVLEGRVVTKKFWY